MTERNTLADLTDAELDDGTEAFMRGMVSSIVAHQKGSGFEMPNGVFGHAIDVRHFNFLKNTRALEKTRSGIAFEVSVASWLLLFEVAQQVAEELGGKKGVAVLHEKVLALAGILEKEESP